MKIAARYAVERTDDVQTDRRFLGVADDGGLGWTSRFIHAAAFPSRRAARDFITHRMGAAADKAAIVRLTIH